MPYATEQATACILSFSIADRASTLRLTAPHYTPGIHIFSHTPFLSFHTPPPPYTPHTHHLITFVSIPVPPASILLIASIHLLSLTLTRDYLDQHEPPTADRLPHTLYYHTPPPSSCRRRLGRTPPGGRRAEGGRTSRPYLWRRNTLCPGRGQYDTPLGHPRPTCVGGGGGILLPSIPVILLLLLSPLSGICAYF